MLSLIHHRRRRSRRASTLTTLACWSASSARLSVCLSASLPVSVRLCLFPHLTASVLTTHTHTRTASSHLGRLYSIGYFKLIVPVFLFVHGRGTKHRFADTLRLSPGQCERWLKNDRYLEASSWCGYTIFGRIRSNVKSQNWKVGWLSRLIISGRFRQLYRRHRLSRLYRSSPGWTFHDVVSWNRRMAATGNSRERRRRNLLSSALRQGRGGSSRYLHHNQQQQQQPPPQQLLVHQHQPRASSSSEPRRDRLSTSRQRWAAISHIVAARTVVKW